MPVVSLIVATHDQPTALGICLRSLQLQTYTHFECIVVHEQSEKMWDSARVVNDLKDPRFKFYSHPHVNDYGIEVKMWGAQHATGTVIGHINGDCYYTPVYLERMVHPIECKRADFTYCDWVTHKNGYAHAQHAQPHEGLIDSAGWLCRADVVKATPWPVEKRSGPGPDGWYVEQLCAKIADEGRVHKIPGVLWVHN